MKFTKGKSGNAGGRPKAEKSVQAAARLHTDRAIEVLAEVMDSPDATPASRVAAAEALLSRGWGKAPQAITGDQGGPVQVIVRWAT